MSSMPIPSLTNNGIRTIASHEKGEQLGDKPVFQIIHIHKFDSVAGQQRFRLVMSDGNMTVNAMLSTQNNDVIHSGELQEFS